MLICTLLGGVFAHFSNRLWSFPLNFSDGIHPTLSFSPFLLSNFMRRGFHDHLAGIVTHTSHGAVSARTCAKCFRHSAAQLLKFPGFIFRVQLHLDPLLPVSQLSAFWPMFAPLPAVSPVCRGPPGRKPR